MKMKQFKFKGGFIMNIAEARSYNDGIDFYNNQKNLTISAQRDENGEIVLKKLNSIRPIEKTNMNLRFIFFLSVIFTLFFYHCNNWKLELTGLLILGWIIVFSYYFFASKDPSKIQSYKYHAAEHKVLNYWDEYEQLPSNCEEVMKMPSISYRCGSTIIAVLLVLATLSILGILFIPWLILKIAWCPISIFLTLKLWANGKCDFLQKLVLIPPELPEVEVAVFGLREYIKIKKEIESTP